MRMITGPPCTSQGSTPVTTYPLTTPLASRHCLGAAQFLLTRSKSQSKQHRDYRGCRTMSAAAVVDAKYPEAVQKLWPSQPTLYDSPVSNNGARARYIIYKKGLEGDVTIKSPNDLGGLKSTEYRTLNPQGLMPLLLMPDGTALYESEIIASYLLDKYYDRGPAMIPSTPELRAKARLVARIVDLYMTPIQACMYRAMPAEERAAKLKQLNEQLAVLEGMVEGPYVLGDVLSGADAAVFPTLVFMDNMLTEYFGWDMWGSRPNLHRYYQTIKADPAGAKVIKEMEDALLVWKENKRWENLGILEQLKEPSFQWAY
eukprot:jgi/Botrbrau1/21026/Bobra.0144s0038.1